MADADFVDPDLVFGALANRDRRTVLQFLDHPPVDTRPTSPATGSLAAVVDEQLGSGSTATRSIDSAGDVGDDQRSD